MMHVMSSLGGIQNLALYYPHLHVPLLQVSLFETVNFHLFVWLMIGLSLTNVDVDCSFAYTTNKIQTMFPKRS